MVFGLRVHVEHEDQVPVMAVEGRVDASSAPILERKILEVFEEQPDILIVDLENVTYLSSGGMRIFLSMTKKMKASGGHLYFCNAKDEVMEIIKMGGFERILSFFPSKHLAKEEIEKEKKRRAS